MRYLIIAIALLGLILLYLTQNQIQQYFYQLIDSRYMGFVMARSFRFLMNDGLVILLIYGLFQEKKYVLVAFYVQLAGIVFILIPYFAIKYFTGYNGPLISFLHRLIINPLLLLLLIPAFYYQKRLLNNE